MCSWCWILATKLRDFSLLIWTEEKNGKKEESENEWNKLRETCGKYPSLDVHEKYAVKFYGVI